MISQTTEYALRAVVWLAGQPSGARTVDQVARATSVPAGYLAKVLQTLAKANVVHSQRGLGGGFTLARSPSELTVLDVVNAVEPIRRIRECPMGVPMPDGTLCALHARLDEAMAAIEDSFRAWTIESLFAAPQAIRSLCKRFPDDESNESEPAGAGPNGRSADEKD